MTEWRFELTKEAEEDLEKLDSSVRDRILEKLK
jgi:mRNA-degrading endonuclease RelE of RelBE toxin-antitoxin system